MAGLADANAAFFSHAVGDFDKLLAALATELGDDTADGVAVDGGVEADVGGFDAFLNVLEGAFVPWGNLDKAGVWRGDGGEIADAHVGAVGLDEHLCVFHH